MGLWDSIRDYFRPQPEPQPEPQPSQPVSRPPPQPRPEDYARGGYGSPNQPARQPQSPSLGQTGTTPSYSPRSSSGGRAQSYTPSAPQPAAAGGSSPPSPPAQPPISSMPNIYTDINVPPNINGTGQELEQPQSISPEDKAWKEWTEAGNEPGLAAPLEASDLMDIGSLGAGAIIKKPIRKVATTKISKELFDDLINKGLIPQGTKWEAYKSVAVRANIQQMRNIFLHSTNNVKKYYPGNPTKVDKAMGNIIDNSLKDLPNNDALLQILKKQKLDYLKSTPGKKLAINTIKVRRKIGQTLGKHITKDNVGRLAKWYAKGTLGAGTVIMTWLALDNIMSGQTFWMNNLNDEITFNENIDVEEAREYIDEQIEYRNNADSILNVIKWSPINIPFITLITGAQGSTEEEFYRQVENMRDKLDEIDLEQKAELEQTEDMPDYAKGEFGEPGQPYQPTSTLGQQPTPETLGQQPTPEATGEEDIIDPDDIEAEVERWELKEKKEHEYRMMEQEAREIENQKARDFWQSYLEQKQANAEQRQRFWQRYQENKQAFWLAYQKKKENEGQSALGFGLL